MYTSLSKGGSILFHVHFPVQRWFPFLWCTLPLPEMVLFPLMYTSLSKGGSVPFDVHFPVQRWFCSLWCTHPCPKVVLFPLMYTSLSNGGSIPFDVHFPVQKGWIPHVFCLTVQRSNLHLTHLLSMEVSSIAYFYFPKMCLFSAWHADCSPLCFDFCHSRLLLVFTFWPHSVVFFCLAKMMMFIWGDCSKVIMHLSMLKRFLFSESEREKKGLHTVMS